MLFGARNAESGKPADPDDDLYEDFNYSIPSQVPGALGQTPYVNEGYGNTPGTAVMRGAAPSTAFRAPGTMAGGRPPPSQMGRMMTGAAPGTALRGGEARPMTSVSGAGYQSKKKGAFDPLNQGRGPAPALAEKADNGPEDLAKEMERQARVHTLIEESAAAGVDSDFALALEKAKEADKKEKALCKHRERHGLVDQINLELTYAVCFNLANCYHQNGMKKEALREYGAIVKNKQHPQAGRLRANMGNVYYEQREYPEAIKNYRMALDQVPNSGKEVRFKIIRNIGTAFVRMGQFQDAIGQYDTIMQGSPDHQTGFNLVLCYYALEDGPSMKKAFQRLVAIPPQGMSEEDNEGEDAKADEAEVTGQVAPDRLRAELKKRQKEASHYVLTAAKLIAPVLDKKDWEAGYDWVVETMKLDHEHLASQMEIEKALQYLKNKDFEKAIEHLKAFEKKDQHLKAMAATNLAFIYFLEGEFKSADSYADMAIRHDRYNAKALVNKGNCLFMAKEYSRAKEIFLEAIGVEVDCVEAIFNLGLVNMHLGLINEALQAFEKLHTIIPNNSEVIYHIANLYEVHQENLPMAAKWFNILLARVPSDPGILSRMGHIATKEDDDSQAYFYHKESYRHYPVNLDVISWLGVWYVKSELYEKAIHFFERAAQIQPTEVKWRLMVTSCYRRMGNYAKALELYESIHTEYPENLECLRYLVAICRDHDRPYQHYQQKLARLDRGASSRGSTTVTNEVAASNQHVPDAGRDGQLALGSRRGSERSTGATGTGSKSPVSAPNARVVDRDGGNTSQGRDDEQDEFGDADVSELLA
ncbi:unnamed protein product [Discosporangium mesarthrocarpum]